MTLEVVEYISSHGVRAERLRNEHSHHLRHESVVVDRGERQRAGGKEVVEFTKVVLCHERVPAILHACVERQILIGECPDRDRLGERAEVERIDAVREPNLSRVWRLVERRVPTLTTRCGRYAELRGDAMMELEIREPIPCAELAGRWLPSKRPAVRQVRCVVRLCDAELTEIVVDREVVSQSFDRLARDEEAGRKSAAEKLLRHLPIGRRPVRPRALYRASGKVR